MKYHSDNKEFKKELIAKIKDYFLSGEEFEIVQNQEFGFLETRGVSLKNIGKYYESEDYISHSDAKKSLFDKAYQFIKKRNNARKLSLIKKATPGKRILDYGCGTGDFLLYAKEKGYDVYGVEPNKKAIAIAKKKLGNKNVTANSLSEIKQKFDIITLWHVLEHIPNLLQFIQELKNHLEKGGRIFIAVPNHHSLDAKHYKQYWAAWDVPRHLWHFTPESMALVLGNYNLKIEKKYPLIFDSYYISLLSEGYKKSSFKIPKAAIMGTCSNLNALFTGNYSSMIFQIKKE